MYAKCDMNIHFVRIGEKMRIWQTRFQVMKALDSFPIPSEIVLERQTDASYHIEERYRKSLSAQISCTLSGEGAFRYRDKVFKLTPGMAFAECIGNPEISYYYPGHGREAWEFIWISFYGASAMNLIQELNARYGYVFQLPLDSGLIAHLQTYKNQRDSFQILSPSAGGKIVMDALAAFGETVEGALVSSPQAKLTKEAQQLIASNLDRSLDVALIAEKLHVTREHLTRVFHSQTGVSPGQFAAAERMRIAARLLLDRRLSVKEIAERLGYDSASSFARAFKAHFSVSPSGYTEHDPADPSVRDYLNAQAANTELRKHEVNEKTAADPDVPRPEPVGEMYDPCRGLY